MILFFRLTNEFRPLFLLTHMFSKIKVEYRLSVLEEKVTDLKGGLKTDLPILNVSFCMDTHFTPFRAKISDPKN
jgi:hypothetical protein